MIPGNTSSQGKFSNAPTSVSASAGNAQATVSFTLPAYDGKGVATYTATSSPGGITGSGSSSPIVVTGLSNGTAYTFTVTTITGYGVSAVSGTSNSVSVGAPPGPPSSASATAGNAQATIQWIQGTDGTGTTTTTISTWSSGNFVKSEEVTAVFTSGPYRTWNIYSLNNGTAYTFKVGHYNTYGSSSATAETNAVTPSAPTTTVTTTSAPPPTTTTTTVATTTVDPCAGVTCPGQCGDSGTVMTFNGYNDDGLASANDPFGNCPGCTGTTYRVWSKPCCPSLACWTGNCGTCPTTTTTTTKATTTTTKATTTTTKATTAAPYRLCTAGNVGGSSGCTAINQCRTAATGSLC